MFVEQVRDNGTGARALAVRQNLSTCLQGEAYVGTWTSSTIYTGLASSSHRMVLEAAASSINLDKSRLGAVMSEVDTQFWIETSLESVGAFR
jgi:hypothetical protein